MKEMNVVLMADEGDEDFSLAEFNELKKFLEGEGENNHVIYSKSGFIVTDKKYLSSSGIYRDSASVLYAIRTGKRIFCMYNDGKGYRYSRRPKGYFYLDLGLQKPQRAKVYLSDELGTMEHSPNSSFSTSYWSLGFDDCDAGSSMVSSARNLAMHKTALLDTWRNMDFRRINEIDARYWIVLRNEKGTKTLERVLLIFWDKEDRLLALDEKEGFVELGKYIARSERLDAMKLL